jgi:thioester reductase-like protein
MVAPSPGVTEVTVEFLEVSLVDTTVKHFPSLIHLLHERATEQPDKSAFVYLLDGETTELPLTYAEIERRSRAVAVVLRESIAAGDRVLVAAPPGPEFVIAFFGCLHAGAVAVPVYPPDPRKLAPNLTTLQGIAEDSGARAILTIADLASVAEPALVDFPRLTELRWIAVDRVEDVAAEGPEVSPQTDDLACLLYTSGSTGKPKGVMLSHGNLLHTAISVAQRVGITPDDKVCYWLPPFHIGGLCYGVLMPIAAGATNITFSPQKFMERPQRWPSVISRYGIAHSGAFSSAYDLCANAHEPEDLKGLDLSKWRSALAGAEAVRRASLEHFTAMFGPSGFRKEIYCPIYGLTESAACIACDSPETEVPSARIVRVALLQSRVETAPAWDENAVDLISTGAPLDGIDVRIVRPDTLETCGDGEVGEIWAAGASIALGYWDRPEATVDTFEGRIAGSSDGPFLRTGDLGYLKDNQLFITGRLKEIIIIRGKNHYPTDIEATVRGSHAGFAGAIVAAFPVEVNSEEQLALAIELSQVPEEGGKLITAARRAVAKNHGIDVSGVLLVGSNEIPRTSSGKIQRTGCTTRVAQGEWSLNGSEGEGEEPIAPLSREQVLAVSRDERDALLGDFVRRHLARVLRISAEDPGLDGSFANLGIDSVMLVKLNMEIRSALGLTIPHGLFFNDASVAKLGAFLAARISGETEDGSDQVDFGVEAELEPGITSEGVPPVKPGLPNKIFITGATGFVGSYLVQHFLTDTPASVYCLTRGRSPEHAHERLIKKQRELPGWNEEFASRIVPVLGDLSRPQMGLTDEQVEYLTENMDALFHNGATVNWVTPYEGLKPSNVDSTLVMLRMATKHHLKPVHFVSSVSVFNSPERFGIAELHEDHSVEAPGKLHGGYPQSKWVSEQHIKEAARRGVPTTILRLGMVFAHSQTGDCQTGDFVCRLAKGCVQLGLFPDSDMTVSLTPVDGVSRMMVRLALDPNAWGRSYHIFTPDTVRLGDVGLLMQAAGYELKLVELDYWLQELMKTSPETNELYGLLEFLTEKIGGSDLNFFDMFTGEYRPTYGYDNVRNVTGGLNYPPLDQPCQDVFFRHMIEIGFMPLPTKAPASA